MRKRLLALAGACALAATTPLLAQVAPTRPPLTRVAPATKAPAPATTAPRPPTPGRVDWPAAATASRRTGDRFSNPKVAQRLDQAAVDRTAIPILLPADLALVKSARIYSFGDQYTVTIDIPGGKLSLTGTTALQPVKSTLAMASAPESLVVQRTVDGQLLSFVRFGVLYTVEIRCSAPADTRCRGEAEVRSLYAKTTVVVLGKAARQAAGMGG